MLDDLRNSSSFLDDEEPQEQEEKVVRRPARRQIKEATFLGMTAKQRFVVSLVLFFMVCLLGIIAVLLSGSVALPI